MRKLAIVCLLVLVGCKRKVSVTTAPSSQPAATANANAPGAANHREAVTKFLQAAKVQDVQALANVWGTAERGPARGFMAPEELEMRVIYMMRCLRHDTHSILSETPAVGDKRIFPVQLKYRTYAAVADFMTTQGPDRRYYLAQLDLEKLNIICSAK